MAYFVRATSVDLVTMTATVPVLEATEPFVAERVEPVVEEDYILINR